MQPTPLTRYAALPTLTARLVLASLLAGAAMPAFALRFEFGDAGEWEVDWDTNITYGATWRVAEPDDAKFAFRDTGDPVADGTRYSLLQNGDDGNNNFKKGSLVQNKVSFVSEADIRRDNYGLFLRARGYYDDVYDGNTQHNRGDFDSYNSGNAPAIGGTTDFREFPDETRDQHRDRAEMLDYFVYYGGELPGDRLFDVRIGSQVINWGEATFTPGINGLQSRADLIARNTPGVEVKEILLPSGALYGQLDLTLNMTLEAYYQYEWRKTEFNGVGSFFSDTDMIGPGAETLLVAINDSVAPFGVPKLTENRPKSHGQYGVAVHWVTENGTDIGAYFVNAHDKTPLPQANAVGGNPIPQTYSLLYQEDIRGYALSFTTVWGIANVQGEISLKQDAPMVDANNNVANGNLLSAQFGGSYVPEPGPFWDDANLTFEIAAAHVTDHDSADLRFDDHAVGINLRFEPAYINVRSGLDLKVPIFLAYGLDGVIRESTLVKDATSFNITFNFVYLNNFSTKFGYTNFLDGGENHLITDRDNVFINFSYSF
ncbi:MAG: DUF1302 family protein [Halioglobus sp.]|nr:DUF1302 family protein [Halioglobus sp.]